jgi:hypothetical protein
MPQLDIACFPSQVFWLVILFLVLFSLSATGIIPFLHSAVETRLKKISATTQLSLEGLVFHKFGVVSANVSSQECLEIVKTASEVAPREASLLIENNCEDAEENFAKIVSKEARSAQLNSFLLFPPIYLFFIVFSAVISTFD